MPVLRTSASDFTAWNRANAVLPANGKAAKSTDTTVDRKAAAVVAIGSMSAIGATASSAISKRWRIITSFLGYLIPFNSATNTVGTYITDSRLGTVGGGGKSMVCDSNGNLFVFTLNNSFYKISPTRTMTTFSTSGVDISNAYISLLFIDPVTNNMYGVTYGGEYCYKITPQGVVSTVATTLGIVYASPGVVDPTNGNLYIPSSGQTKIIKVTQAGVVTTVYSDPSFTPRCLFLDKTNTYLYGISGSSPATIFTLPLSTAIPTFVTVTNSGNIEIETACLDKTGTYFLGTTYNKTIVAIPIAGGSMTIAAGITDVSGSQDGPGSSATFAFISGTYFSAITLLLDGTIVILDCPNSKIRTLLGGAMTDTSVVYYR